MMKFTEVSMNSWFSYIYYSPTTHMHMQCYSSIASHTKWRMKLF